MPALTLSPRVVRVLVAVLVVATLAIGLGLGTFVAGGADSYAYVSQAKLWSGGNLRITQPWVQRLSWPGKERPVAPLGYRLLSNDGTIVPTAPPGLPMLMAAFEWIFGANGPFIVIPVLGALAVWCTYLLGREASRSRIVGLTAAALLLTSPVFLSYLMQPLTDVAVAAGWTLVCLMAFRRVPHGLLSGLAAGLSLLIRPNLLPLALVPSLAWAWPCLTGKGNWRNCLRDTAAFCVGLTPALIAIAAINDHLYGSPLASGYGSVGDLYSLKSAPTNLRHYSMWLMSAHTPLILLALWPIVSPTSLREDDDRSSARVGLTGLVALTFLSYIFYETFDAWFYLRFLLPAFPALFILMAAAIRSIALRLPSSYGAPAAAFVCVSLMAYNLKAGYDWGIFNQRTNEQRYVKAAGYAERFTPPNAAFIATQHSGSLRYYANRITLRWDSLPADRLDWAIQELKEVGYRPYILLDHTEEPTFISRFGARNAVGKLDWRPMAEIKSSTNVRIYDPEDRRVLELLRRK
jgi:hypothetical protein